MDSDNLTGEQIQQILDLFMLGALREVVENCSVFDVQVVYLLGRITKNRKRKLSSASREVAISNLCAVLVSSCPDEKMKLLGDSKLERGFIHTFITRLLKELSEFATLYRESLFEKSPANLKVIERRLQVIAASVGSSDPEGLYTMCCNAQAYLEKFYEYRSSVISLYLKHASKQANGYIKVNGNNFDFHDVRQTILKGVITAIDKYDSQKGALTSYVNWWILNAVTCAVPEHEYGTAYLIPQTQRRKVATGKSTDVNYSISLDQLRAAGAEDDDTSNLHASLDDGSCLLKEMERVQDEELIQYLVKCVDPKGCVRLTLDIGEFFSQREQRRMRKIMRKQTETKKSKRKRRSKKQ